MWAIATVVVITSLAAGSKQPRAPATPFLTSLIRVRDSISPGKQFFFPGHSSGRFADRSALDQLDIFEHDLPELDGLDNIHAPEGPLLESLQLAAEQYGAKQSWYLVNGSTSGLLASILAFAASHRSSRKGARGKAAAAAAATKRPILIVTRDAHKSVFDALWVAQCDAFVLPCLVEESMGVSLGLDPAAERQLDDFLQSDRGNSVCGMVITRPTYQGVMMSPTDLEALAAVLHKHQVPLLVDEAHGSHIRFLGDGSSGGGGAGFVQEQMGRKEKMRDAISCGADVVVQSSHKTLTALSQCAMMHLSASENCSWGHDGGGAAVLQQSFSAMTTTSPNAFLLASLDAARAQMAPGGDGSRMLAQASTAVDELKAALRKSGGGGIVILDDVLLLRLDAKQQRLQVDPLRLTVSFPGAPDGDATKVDDWLCDEHGIYCELNLPKCITYVIPPGATRESLAALQHALILAANKWGPGPAVDQKLFTAAALQQQQQAGFIDTGKTLDGFDAETVAVEEAAGRVCAETICLYPPGIPLVIRGETIDANLQQLLTSLKSSGGNDGLSSGRSITGAADGSLCTVAVFANDQD